MPRVKQGQAFPYERKIDLQVEAEALAEDLTTLARRVRQLRIDIRDLVQI